MDLSDQWYGYMSTSTARFLVPVIPYHFRAKRPDLYAYTPEALQRSMIVCQQLWSEETFGELVLAEIGRCLDHPESRKSFFCWDINTSDVEHSD